MASHSNFLLLEEATTMPKASQHKLPSEIPGQGGSYSDISLCSVVLTKYAINTKYSTKAAWQLARPTMVMEQTAPSACWVRTRLLTEHDSKDFNLTQGMFKNVLQNEIIIIIQAMPMFYLFFNIQVNITNTYIL